MMKKETIKSRVKGVFSILIGNSIGDGIEKREKRKKPSNEKLTKNGVVMIVTIIQMMGHIDRDHDHVVDRDHTQEDIRDLIRGIEIQKKGEDTDPKHHIQDRDHERGNDHRDRVTSSLAVGEVIPEVEQEVQCVGVVHLEEVVLIVHVEVRQGKCLGVAEVVAPNKIVGG